MQAAPVHRCVDTWWHADTLIRLVWGEAQRRGFPGAAEAEHLPIRCGGPGKSFPTSITCLQPDMGPGGEASVTQQVEGVLLHTQQTL